MEKMKILYPLYLDRHARANSVSSDQIMPFCHHTFIGMNFVLWDFITMNNLSKDSGKSQLIEFIEVHV